jgi:hypothetical protein
MPLTPSQQKREYVLNTLRALLVNRYSPLDGLPVEELTKMVWPQWRFFAGTKFRKESMYIERALMELRRIAEADYHQRVAEAIREDPTHPQTSAYFVDPPDFMPHALAVKERYWNYFNCVKKPHTEDVAKICRSRAAGLVRRAEFIEEAFRL